MADSDDGGDRLRSGIWADVYAGGTLGVSLATVTPAGATFPVGDVASLAFSTGLNPVHSWMNDGGALDFVTFLKASLWN
jgi:hypothetical protein